MIHIEGMGWFGSALAHELDAVGIPFTWHDIEHSHNAWQASTGIAYPCGDARSQRNLELWRNVYLSSLGPYACETVYCFAHKSPPHQGKYKYTDLGSLRVAHEAAVTVDVPAFVTATRARFAERRVQATPGGVPKIVAHGFHSGRDHYLWGWSTLVRINTSKLEQLYPLAAGRYSFYARAHRFQMVYAYPVATQPGWWRAGSALTVQKTARTGNAAQQLASWMGAFEKIYPLLALEQVGETVQGWRPAPKSEADAQLSMPDDNTLVFPSLARSGVRWAPQLLTAAVAWAQQRQTRRVYL